ncbi:MAG: hypothetical protein WAM28_02035 [Chlamydiales bacterium]
MRKKWILFTLAFLTLQLVTEADEVLIDTREGETFLLQVDPNESLLSIQQRVSALTEGAKTEGMLIEIASEDAYLVRNLQSNVKHGGYLGFPRNYYADLNAQEKTDISFIVSHLANKSVVSIAMEQTALKQAGDRIDHIHPLRFLMFVFTDESLKVAVRNIRGKGLVWNQFAAGLKDSLATESRIKNMKDEFIADFSKKVGIKSSIIYPSIRDHQWDQFIDLLITHVPRKGDYDRYSY